MTATLAPPPPPPPVSTPPTPAPSTPPAASPRRRRNAGHVIAIVIGCLALFPSFGMITGGGAMLIGQEVATDGDGYFRFTLDRVGSEGVAVAATDLWLDDVDADIDGDAAWVFDWFDVDARLRVQGASSTDAVFVGIARTADVERYLEGSMYSEVIDLDGSRSRYDQIAGVRSIQPPVEQTFWRASVSGVGEQELRWKARGGRWSIVVMNADGTANVEADIEVGARVGAVTPVSVTLLSIGGLLLVGAVVLIVVGARGRRIDGQASPQAVFVASPVSPPTSASAQSETAEAQ